MNENNFEFVDDNQIIWQVRYLEGKFWLIRNINGYWVTQREVKNNSLNNQPTELEMFRERALRQFDPKVRAGN